MGQTKGRHRYCDVTIWMNGNDSIQAALKAW